jgi:hypothetical protein
MRAGGFNKCLALRFFEELEEQVGKKVFRPISPNQCRQKLLSSIHVDSRVISVRGKRNWERHSNRNVTMFCVHATGKFIAPLLILWRETINQRLVLNASVDAAAAVDG